MTTPSSLPETKPGWHSSVGCRRAGGCGEGGGDGSGLSPGENGGASGEVGGNGGQGAGTTAGGKGGLVEAGQAGAGQPEHFVVCVVQQGPGWSRLGV
jgi:hypothetical protein